VCPRACLEAVEERKIGAPAGNRTPGRPARSLVTILTELLGYYISCVVLLSSNTLQYSSISLIACIEDWVIYMLSGFVFHAPIDSLSIKLLITFLRVY
jgi:hypothetical protein